ncbi:MAG: alpha/beta hydrolase, partial [Enterovibrio sp.]
RPACDLHFVASLNDRLVNFKAAKAMANSWNVPLIVNEKDGHDIALDNPEWLLNLIASKLNNRPNASRLRDIFAMRLIYCLIWYVEA